MLPLIEMTRDLDLNSYFYLIDYLKIVCLYSFTPKTFFNSLAKFIIAQKLLKNQISIIH